MGRIALIAFAAGVAAPALAHAQDPHAHHHAPAQPAAAAQDRHAGHASPAQPPPADPHAHHGAPAQPAATPDPHAGHAGHAPAAADPHAGHGAAPAAQPAGSAPPPPVPTDHAAERFYGREEMAAARAQLRLEHGGMRWSKVMLETFEARPASGEDVFAFEGRASFGGDINRLALKAEVEVEDEVHEAEVQALYSRAVTPYFNLIAGVRQDFEPGPSRTYATLGFDGVAPYWFELEGAVFLSHKGDLSARVEGSYDLRLTQKLILEPRVEANLFAQDVPALGVGSGLSDLELGLRLRYAIRPEFAPYVGVHWERKFGDTADFARDHGEGAEDTRLVIGLRAWF